jgi:hypothetical protein
MSPTRNLVFNFLEVAMPERIRKMISKMLRVLIYKNILIQLIYSKILEILIKIYFAIK